ncbi:S41 family peptidase [Anaeromyxobacter oryzae]|uniref:Peptidase S41 n=1 Tax=Anaeromyxobacter oryzae TaxID=2918170 RepID=A0ABM7WXS1_9BACT|nr:S41 family peptidase [Anaeromyxobacter oryzae]BDG04325.1 peptidase S41 [Anaeromyxobacter oryzae]
MKRIAVAAAIGLAFFAGLVTDHVAAAARKPDASAYRPLDVFADVLSHIENSYVEDVAEKDLVYGAIDGMMAQLDPHSQFMRPDVYAQLRDETTGEFDGLGIEVTRASGEVTVVSPVADSPGERAGIRPGDRIVTVDGAPTKDLGVDEVTRRMKGPAGTRCVLEIMRDGFASPQKLTLVRDRVRTQSVDSRVLDADRRYLYVRLKSFQERTGRGLEKALADGRAALRGEIRGLVLDLRNNPGGLVDEAVSVSDVFLAGGTVVSTEGRGKRNVEVWRAHEKGTEPPYPIIVLVNRGTASASEIVAGALQDNGRAVIMGTQTFGKGSVQTIVELGDGSGLKLTVARYYTPRKRSIQELGITPDVVVADVALPARPEDVLVAERDLKGHLKNDVVPASTAAAAPTADFQLKTALDYLRAADIIRASSEPKPRGVTAKGE